MRETGWDAIDQGLDNLGRRIDRGEEPHGIAGNEAVDALAK